MASLKPDYMFHTFDEITAEFLTSVGVRGVILDIDNTLEPYEHPKPGKHVTEWLNSLAEAGIHAAFVSNNDENRVGTFNEELKLPAFPKAGKPFSGGVRKAMRALGSTKENTLLIGDQVFTDVWAARSAGIRAALVPPIKDKTDLLTRSKRWLERPILKNMKYEEK